MVASLWSRVVSQLELIGARVAVVPPFEQSSTEAAMHWALLILLTMVAVGDLARDSTEVAVEWASIFLISAIAAGEMARARRRSLYAWVGWTTIIGPLAVVLLLALGPKKRIDDLQVSN
jgi:hypothetical protein